MKRPVVRSIVWWGLPAVPAAIAFLVLPAGPSSSARGAVAVASATKGPAPSPPPGQALYSQDCATCHGADGHGTSRAPSLAGVGMAEVDFQLSTGRMPRRDTSPKQTPYVATLSKADIAALDQFVTALAAHGGPPIPEVNPASGDLARGGEVFRQDCAACHSELGAGGELVDHPVPAVTEATPTQIAEAVRAGAVYMPHFGSAAISQHDLNSIVAYIQYLKHPKDEGGNPLTHLGPVAEGMVTWFIAMIALLGLIRWIGQRG